LYHFQSTATIITEAKSVYIMFKSTSQFDAVGVVFIHTRLSPVCLHAFQRSNMWSRKQNRDNLWMRG